MLTYSHFDYYLRSIITSVLALGILSVTAWQVLKGQGVSGPFGSWAGLIIGVYFGQHVALNGSGSKKLVADAQVQAVNEHAAQPPAAPTVRPGG